MRALQIGREEAFLNGFEAWKSGCKWEKDGLLRTRTLIIHSQTHKATTPRHDPWESAHSNLAPRNDHERGGAGLGGGRKINGFTSCLCWSTTKI